MADLVPYLFWEKQEGQLCAQHCLNSLLQGELFTAVDLSIIARELDQAEQAALQEGAYPGEFKIDPQNNISQNMDDSGFFSVQVLSHALKVWNLEIVPIGSMECRSVREYPEVEIAYICNLHQHWFTLRKFGGQATRWYNLDSLLKGPEWISETYLGMLITQLENDGYSIFVVKGLLSSSQADVYAEEHPEPFPERKDKSPEPIEDDEYEDAMVAAAIAASLENFSKENIGNSLSQSDQSTTISTTIEPSLEELRTKSRIFSYFKN
ncbi:hypothetical protein G9A89_001094 [Geosiphon pyriformis]|nr:hypothetical protein G9A89_001094 [Geosiphon pyriformis]